MPDFLDRWVYTHQDQSLGMDVNKLGTSYEAAAGSRSRYAHLLSPHLPVDKSSKILDLPCGEGKMLFFLRKLGYSNIQGCDIDPRRIEVCQKLDLPCFQGDVFDALREQPDQSVAVLFSLDFIEHLEKGHVIQWLELASLKVAPNGLIVVRTPCASSPFGLMHIFNDFSHKWAATHGVLERLLKASGFKSVMIYGEEPMPTMRFGFLRMLAFKIFKRFAGIFTFCLGVPTPEIWSPSMWAIGQKSNV